MASWWECVGRRKKNGVVISGDRQVPTLTEPITYHLCYREHQVPNVWVLWWGGARWARWHIPTIAERAWGRESNFIPSLWTGDCTTLHLTEEWPWTSDPPISTSGVLMTATHYYAYLCQVGDWTQGILNARQFLYPLSYSPRLKGKRDFSLMIFGLGPPSLEFFFVN